MKTQKIKTRSIQMIGQPKFKIKQKASSRHILLLVFGILKITIYKFLKEIIKNALKMSIIF